MPVDIDKLTPTKGLIDLNKSANWEASILAEDFVFSGVFGDAIFAEYVDLSDDGDCIKRGSLFIPENAAAKAWRYAKVILKGPDVDGVDVGDIVIFPNNLGMPVEDFAVAVDGEIRKVESGLFLNEQRLFGRCSQKENYEDRTISTTDALAD
mgnify:CR=1 FL=1|tara:strand:- start:5827 stop:6282 length:456 start_codon:yes stop_codon:yes gene_type:complete